MCEHIDSVAFKEGRIIVLLQIHRSKILCYLSQFVVTFFRGGKEEGDCKDHIAESNPNKRWCCTSILEWNSVFAKCWLEERVGGKCHLPPTWLLQSNHFFARAVQYLFSLLWPTEFIPILTEICAAWWCTSADFLLYFTSATNPKWPLNPSFQLSCSTASAACFCCQRCKFEPLLMKLCSLCIFAYLIITGSSSTTKLENRKLDFRHLSLFITQEKLWLYIEDSGFHKELWAALLH